MSALFTILAILALVGSILITLVVLLQNSKGGGLASNFTAGNQTFGVRQTTDILEKITWGLAIFILVVSIAASFAYDKKSNKYSGMVSNQTVNSTAPVIPTGNNELAGETAGVGTDADADVAITELDNWYSRLGI